MSDVEGLRAARDLIEKGWCQNAFRRNDKGQYSYCALGACEEVFVNDTWLRKSLGRGPGQGIMTWNDAPGRSQAEVLELFDRAIALAELDLAIERAKGSL